MSTVDCLETLIWLGFEMAHLTELSLDCLWAGWMAMQRDTWTVLMMEMGWEQLTEMGWEQLTESDSEQLTETMKEMSLVCWKETMTQ